MNVPVSLPVSLPVLLATTGTVISTLVNNYREFANNKTFKPVSG